MSYEGCWHASSKYIHEVKKESFYFFLINKNLLLILKP